MKKRICNLLYNGLKADVCGYIKPQSVQETRIFELKTTTLTTSVCNGGKCISAHEFRELDFLKRILLIPNLCFHHSVVIGIQSSLTDFRLKNPSRDCTSGIVIHRNDVSI